MKLSDTQRRVLERMNDGEVLRYYIWGGVHYYIRGIGTVLSATAAALERRQFIKLAEREGLTGSYEITDAGREAVR